MQDGNQEWSWVSEDGIEYPVSESELAFALSSEEVAPYALVWKRGWSEWLPAMQVAELQWALPAGTADAPRKPQLTERGSRRPPPLERYAEFKQRSLDLKTGVATLGSETLASAPSSPSYPPMTALRRETTPELARISSTGWNQPAFTREDADEKTVQIDGDELARVRLESIMIDDFDDPVSHPQVQRPVENLEQTPRSVLPPPVNPRAPSRPSLSPRPPSASVPSYPSVPPGMTQGSIPPGVVPRASLAPNPLQTYAPPPAPEAPEASSRLPLLAIGCALAAGALGALWLRFSRDLPSAQNVAAVTSPPAASSRPVGPKQCRVSRAGALLAEWAYPKIEPTFAVMASSDRLAVGYAQTSRYAVGMTLDPVSMRADKVFSEFQNSPLLTVTPITSGAQLSFRPTRAAATLQSATAIDGKVPFAFGWTHDGFGMRRDTDAVDQMLWKTSITTSNVPSVAKLDPKTFAFALRAGGERGNILLGKLRDTGEAVGDLIPLKLGEGRIGLPAMRIGDTRTLVTFTLGPTDQRGDIYLADSKKPALPTQARVVMNAASGVFSPQAIEIGEEGFLLQFARGEPGNQQVVAQVYDFDRNKVGSEFVVSPADLDAHAGTLWSRGKAVLSLYMVRTDQAYALWGTRLDCE